jgi:DNA-binding LytR/AlgR family response regulator
MHNTQPDLIFMDIQLGDGISFEIFELVSIQCPIIFITAYNDYAIQAFKVNSIDYLLKPLDKESLFQAMEKYHTLFSQPSRKTKPELGMDVLKELFQSYGTAYKNRFIVKVGEHLKAVQVKDILFFFSREKGTFAQSTDKKRYLLDYTLDQIEQITDPNQFFRINRQYIVKFEAIQDMISYTNSRLRLLLYHAEDHKEVIVSREKVNEFKSWLDK